MSDGASPERTQDICNRILAGESMRSIARDYGVSGERVRQIAAKNGVRSVARDRAIARRLKIAEVAALRERRRAQRVADVAPRLAAARAAVERGVSIRQAMFKRGFEQWEINRLASGKGWPTQHGRWRNKSNPHPTEPGNGSVR